MFVTVLARRSSVKMKERKRRQKRLSFADKGRKTSPPLAHGRRCEKALSLSLSLDPAEIFSSPFPPKKTPPPPSPPRPPHPGPPLPLLHRDRLRRRPPALEARIQVPGLARRLPPGRLRLRPAGPRRAARGAQVVRAGRAAERALGDARGRRRALPERARRAQRRRPGGAGPVVRGRRLRLLRPSCLPSSRRGGTRTT